MNIVKMNLIVAGFLLVLPFARAQACDPDFPGEILNACGSQDLMQFESDAVTTWLQLHQLPASDRAILYTYGRADVRNEIRGIMFDDLIRIIQEDPASRTPHETALYNWLKGVVDPLELQQYKDAAADADKWKADPCDWSPDPDVAAAYGLKYDNTAYCSGDPLITGFSVMQVPSQSYFLAAALKATYGNAVTSIPYASATLEGVQIDSYKMFGYAAIPAAGLSLGSALATYQFFLNSPSGGILAQIWKMDNAAAEGIKAIGQADGLIPEEAADAAEELQAATTEAEIEAVEGAAADFAAAPAAFVLIAVEIGIEAGFNFIDSEEALNEVNELDGFPSQFQNSGGANLQNFLANGTGLYQLQVAFTSQTLPERPSTAALPEHRDGVDPYFVLQNPQTGATTETQTLTYTDVAGIKWSLQTYEGFFLKSGTLSDGTVVNTISPTLTITDPYGITWNVDWVGEHFLLTQTAPQLYNNSDNILVPPMVCPADPLTGVSVIPFKTYACSSYMADNFQIQDGTHVWLGQSPVFTGDPVAGFAAGSSFSVNITAAGIPTPAISTTGAIPPGVTVSGGKNGAPLALSGSGLVKGTYTIPLQATNGTGSATENFTLVMGTVPQIVSAAQFTDHAGTPETFTIRAAGDTPLTFSLGPGFKMPPGYTFRDNKNGTATISGTDPGNVNGNSCSTQACVYGGTVQATNISGQASQNLTIPYVLWPPAALSDAYNDHPTTTFRAGVGNSFTIETNGAATPSDTVVADFGPPVTITEGSTLPGWLQFKDNGDGTATFSGQPPETATSYDVSASIALDKAGDTPSVYPVTIHVSAAPVFLDTGNQLRTKCMAGYGCGLAVHTNMAAGTFTLTGDAPGVIEQTVTPGVGELFYQTTTGGAYPITVKASNSYGEAFQDYTLYVEQAPGFPTAPAGQLDIWLMAKVPASYSIPTTGYPHDRGVDVSVDTGHTGQYLPEMKLGLSGDLLPPGISFTDHTSAGIPTGTGLFSGTPDPFGAGRDYQVLLSADNGLKASLPITIHVRAAGDVNNDGQVNCGDFNTFRAALGTYAGQPNYNVLADINGDGAVNVKDLFLVARYLPRGCPIQ